MTGAATFSMQEDPRRYRPLSFDHVEDVEAYRPGGFHPVHLGDLLNNGRYRIVHKLGFGGFSTVWLARDNATHGWVAVKVIAAHASAGDDDGCDAELRIARHLDRWPRVAEHPAHAYLAAFLDEFRLTGPNGRHTCLVSTVAGPSVAQICDSPGKAAGSRRLRGDLARKVAGQAAEAMAAMHSAGVVHGDFTPSNVLFELAGLATWSDDDVYSRLGRPVTEAVCCLSPNEAPTPMAPSYVVAPANMRLLDTRWIQEQIVVIDFGQSFLLPSCPSAPDQQQQQQQQYAPSPRHVGTPLGYCAPELLFDSAAADGPRAGLHTDVWALGCTHFEMRAGGPLFATFFGGRDEVVRQLVQTLGKLPEPWWSEWAPRQRYFGDDGRPRSDWADGVPLAVAYPLGEMVRDIGADDDDDDDDAADVGEQDGGGDRGRESAGDFAVAKRSCESDGDDGHQRQPLLEARGTRLSEAEATSLEDLLSRVIRYSPSERMNADRIAEHPWMHSQF